MYEGFFGQVNTEHREYVTGNSPSTEG